MSRKFHKVIQNGLTGIYTTVVYSTNHSSIGLKGRIVNETRNMLMIKNGSGIKKIEKKNSRFLLHVPDQFDITVDGRMLVGTPHELIKRYSRR